MGDMKSFFLTLCDAFDALETRFLTLCAGWSTGALPIPLFYVLAKVLICRFGCQLSTSAKPLIDNGYPRSSRLLLKNASVRR
jgi:hypothetical protein